jgi:putative solute:sodium symporter small subunit
LITPVSFNFNKGNKHMNQSNAYWHANLKLMAFCLAIWFLVSFVCGILLVDQLNTIRLGGYKLGFWFAQQGSIYVFLVLIFFYAFMMNKLDRKYGVEE